MVIDLSKLLALKTPASGAAKVGEVGMEGAPAPRAKSSK